MPQHEWDPFEGMTSLRRDLQQLFKDFLDKVTPGHVEPHTYQPIADVVETPTEVRVRVQVPGVQREHIQLMLTDETLTIKGQIPEEAASDEAAQGQRYHQREFYPGPFARTIRLPTAVQTDKAAARLQDGILLITLPKIQPTQGRDIPIQQ